MPIGWPSQFGLASAHSIAPARSAPNPPSAESRVFPDDTVAWPRDPARMSSAAIDVEAQAIELAGFPAREDHGHHLPGKVADRDAILPTTARLREPGSRGAGDRGRPRLGSPSSQGGVCCGGPADNHPRRGCPVDGAARSQSTPRPDPGTAAGRLRRRGRSAPAHPPGVGSPPSSRPAGHRPGDRRRPGRCAEHSKELVRECPFETGCSVSSSPLRASPTKRMTTALSSYVLYVADRSPYRLRSDERCAVAAADPCSMSGDRGRVTEPRQRR